MTLQQNRRRWFIAMGMGVLLLSFFIAMAPATAFAQSKQTQGEADADYDEISYDTEEDYADEDIAYEDDYGADWEDGYEPVVTENTSGQPFSIEGNGELLDEAADDDTKEFLTVQTKNNQTFFLVIDRAAATDNVYMLSLIDENDLKGFLDEEEESGLVLSTPQVTTEDMIAEADKQDSPFWGYMKMLGIMILIGAVVCGAFFYIRIYKPQKEEKDAGSEHMETELFSREEIEDESDDLPVPDAEMIAEHTLMETTAAEVQQIQENADEQAESEE